MGAHALTLGLCDAQIRALDPCEPEFAAVVFGVHSDDVSWLTLLVQALCLEPPPELALAHSTTIVYSDSTAFMNAYHIDVHAVLVSPRCAVVAWTAEPAHAQLARPVEDEARDSHHGVTTTIAKTMHVDKHRKPCNAGHAAANHERHGLHAGVFEHGEPVPHGVVCAEQRRSHARRGGAETRV
eukprot:COSAG02_NODE_797_length_17106_cov_4.363615_2_plen_183_part_00